MQSLFKKSNALFGVFLLFSCIGIINAGYLTFTAFAGVAPECTIIHGCDLVAASSYSRIFGIPLALFGVFFYALIGGFTVWGLMNRSIPLRLFLQPLTALGFVLSLYFLYLQAFVIHAFCEYCLLSLFDASVLFVASFFIPKSNRGILEETEVQAPTL